MRRNDSLRRSSQVKLLVTKYRANEGTGLSDRNDGLLAEAALGGKNNSNWRPEERSSYA
jgi:hypothetical protein